MPFQFTERRESQESTSNPPTVTLKYAAQGEPNAAIVKALAASLVPALVAVPEGILYRQDIKVDPQGYALYHVDAPFAQRKIENGSYRCSFDTTGGSLTIKASLQTVAKYKQPGDASTIPDQKGAIGVKSDKEVEGATIVVPAAKMTVHFKHPRGVITIPRFKDLSRMTGKVNNDTFLGFSPGETLFLGFKGEEGSDVETEAHYDFAFSENLQNQVIGGITVLEKQGWDVFWVSFKNDDDAGKAISPPEYIYVERVYRRIAMAASLGFGG